MYAAEKEIMVECWPVIPLEKAARRICIFRASEESSRETGLDLRLGLLVSRASKTLEDFLDSWKAGHFNLAV